ILEVERYPLVRELLQDRRAAARAHHDPAGMRGRDARTQGAARQHQGIGERCERGDVEIDPLEPARRALEIAVVERKHYGASRARAEDAREAVLHSPVVRAGTSEEEGIVGCRDLRLEVFLDLGVDSGHYPSFQVPAARQSGRTTPSSE